MFKFIKKIKTDIQKQIELENTMLEYRQKVLNILAKNNASFEETELVTDDVIRTAIKDGRTPENLVETILN